MQDKNLKKLLKKFSKNYNNGNYNEAEKALLKFKKQNMAKNFLNLNIDLNKSINIQNVGFLTWSKPFYIGYLKTQTLQPELVKYNVNIANNDISDKHCLCNLNDEYLMIGFYKTNKIFMFDKDLKCTNIPAPTKVHPYLPKSICCSTNNPNFIYYLSFGNQEIHIVDRKINKIVRKISKLEFGDFFYPISITFFNRYLYVLNRCECKVLKFKENGDYLSYFHMYDTFDVNNRFQDTLLKWPLHIRVTQTSICVLDDWKCIYIYDYNGQLKQIITNKAILNSNDFLTESDTV